MKKRIILSTAVLLATFSVFISQKAKAVPEGKSVLICKITSDDGTLISVGSTCDTGQQGCIANPCTGDK